MLNPETLPEHHGGFSLDRVRSWIREILCKLHARGETETPQEYAHLSLSDEDLTKLHNALQALNPQVSPPGQGVPTWEPPIGYHGGPIYHPDDESEHDCVITKTEEEDN